MHYIKHFDINGVDTRQVACIELKGQPNASTEGCVGVLGIDVLSPTHEVYKCVARNGGVYKWELLSAGTSIISAKISGEGGEAKSFPYTSLLMPDNYIIKVGDLILDSGGYLYQIKALGVSECEANYCGTQIGGIATGDRNCVLRIINGRLELVTESGNVVSSLEYLLPDYDTVYRDSATGKIIMTGIKTINDTVLRFFVGTKDEYNSLSEEQKINLFALITDDDAKAEFDELKTNVAGFLDGTKKVKKAESAESATNVEDIIDLDDGAENANVRFQIGDKVFLKVIDNVYHATNARNVDYLQNDDNNDNADIEFTIGDKSFSKTVNNVAKADSAKEVETLRNIDESDNAIVSFQIGNKGYYKTVNNVETADNLSMKHTLNVSDNVSTSGWLVEVELGRVYVASFSMVGGERYDTAVIYFPKECVLNKAYVSTSTYSGELWCTYKGIDSENNKNIMQIQLKSKSGDFIAFTAFKLARL